MKWVLIYALATYPWYDPRAIATHSVDFADEELCRQAKTVMLQPADPKSFRRPFALVLWAECFRKGW
ncbi:hypothetical protein HYW59_00200 [Candidatus Kaiserbacteria bacterium]|nr:hypothetical protein [Candidatus Kaiserbacteria bacterium]